MIDRELRREIEYWKRELDRVVDNLTSTLSEVQDPEVREGVDAIAIRLKRVYMDVSKVTFDDDLQATLASIRRGQSAHA
jgi:hypothetical protein